jgi:hypothetical protein
MDQSAVLALLQRSAHLESSLIFDELEMLHEECRDLGLRARALQETAVYAEANAAAGAGRAEAKWVLVQGLEAELAEREAEVVDLGIGIGRLETARTAGAAGLEGAAAALRAQLAVAEAYRNTSRQRLAEAARNLRGIREGIDAATVAQARATADEAVREALRCEGTAAILQQRAEVAARHSDGLGQAAALLLPPAITADDANEVNR